MSFGIAHEKDGIRYYENAKSLTVRMTGIHMLPCGYLGASPDGLVGKQRIVEVKCPFSLRKKTLEEALFHPYCCIERHLDNGFQLKKEHNYWHQVQGCMYVTRRTKCDFIYWTPKWQILFEVKFDHEWVKNIQLLRIFYEQIMLPFLLK